MSCKDLGQLKWTDQSKQPQSLPTQTTSLPRFKTTIECCEGIGSIISSYTGLPEHVILPENLRDNLQYSQAPYFQFCIRIFPFDKTLARLRSNIR
jgi:hypothetical protein